MNEWLHDLFRDRPMWMNAVMVFCAYMAFVYVPWDLFFKPTEIDREVWFGITFTGGWAKLMAIPHWVVYGGAVYGFRRRRPWMAIAAPLYTAQVAFGMAVWPIVYFGGLLGPLLGLRLTEQVHTLPQTVAALVHHARDTNLFTLAVGAGTMALILVLRRIHRKIPGPLLAMVGAAVVVSALGLDQRGVAVVGTLPTGLPPLVELPLFDLELVGQLSAGALAVAAIGLTEAVSIARSIATRSNQRLDSNQELVGQGLGKPVKQIEMMAGFVDEQANYYDLQELFMDNLPDDVTFEEAALTEPLAVAVHSVHH